MTYFEKHSKPIRYLLLIFLVISFFPDRFYIDPAPGLDNSWQIALNLAFKFHLVFGKSFVFTYGPLGVLVSRLPISVPFMVYFLFDLYFGITLILILRDIFRKHFSYGLVIFLFLGFTLASYQMPDLVYLLYFLFYLFAFIKEPGRPGLIIQAALLSIIGFYIKVSGGTVQVMLFLTALAYVFIRRKIGWKPVLLILVIYLTVIGLSARLLHVYLPGYLRSSLELIRSYNDAMVIGITDATVIYAWLALAIILVVLSWIGYTLVRSVRRKEWLPYADELFIYGILAASIYFLFKATFVRADDHIAGFYRNIALLAGFLFLYCPPIVKRKFAAIACTLILLASVWALNALNGNYEPVVRIARLTFLSEKIKDIGHYFGSMAHYGRELARSEGLDSTDNEWKRIIGNSTVDIVPIDISLAYFSGLHYDPRPVIQSYSTYNGYLDNLNYQKYISPSAPEYILYETSVTDSRYLFFDEAWTKLAMLRHYTLIGKFKQFLVLKRREQPVIAPEIRKEVKEARFNEDIPIGAANQAGPANPMPPGNQAGPANPTPPMSHAGAANPTPPANELQYSRILVRYSLWGKIRSFFFQPPPFEVRITLDNGNSWTYRGVKPILEGGVLVNKFIYNDESFQTWLLSHGSSNLNIRSIRIVADSAGNAPGFAGTIRIESAFYPGKDRSVPEQKMDMLNLVNFAWEKQALIRSFQPALADTARYEKADLRYFIDNFIMTPLFISIDGWAFREAGYNANNEVRIVARCGEKLYELPTTPYAKYGIGSVFKRDDITNMGFYSTVARTFLPPGTYDLGISVIDTTVAAGGKRWLSYTGRQFTIPSTGTPGLERVDPATLGAINSSELQYNIDNVEDKGKEVLVWGWAYTGKKDARTSPVNLLLLGNGSGYRVKTSVAKRHDVAVVGKNPLMEYSGFDVFISKEDLPDGVYTIGIEKVDPSTRQRYVVVTGKKLEIQ